MRFRGGGGGGVGGVGFGGGARRDGGRGVWPCYPKWEILATVCIMAWDGGGGWRGGRGEGCVY